MLVVGHGNVREYCDAHDMVIINTYHGELEEYPVTRGVLVTDQKMSSYEYFYLKGKLYAQGVELIHTEYKDNVEYTESLVDYIYYAENRAKEERREKYTGRSIFGYRKVRGQEIAIPKLIEVVKRIFELRDGGKTLAVIREDEGVRHLDGRKLSISTIQTIVNNRERYGL